MPKDKFLRIFVLSVYKLIDNNFAGNVTQHETLTGSHMLTYQFQTDEFNIVITRKSEEQMVLHPLSDINDLDDVCRELGIQDSHVTPAEAVRELNAEIEALRERLKPQQQLADELERK